MNKVCVVGGGASGIMAALYAAKNGAKVTVYEGNNEPLHKLLRTGNGKCNISNINMSYEYYNTDSPSFVKNIYEKMSPRDILFYLNQIGLMIKEKNGYLYPYSEQAKSVKDVLLAEATSLYVDIKTDSFVNCISKTEEGFLVSIEGKKERFLFDKIILATGGKAGLLKKERENGYKLINSFSIPITELYPGLTKVTCEENWVKSLDGIRQDAFLKLYIDDELVKCEAGEVLFRENGISGICVFILSSLCSLALAEKKKIKLSVDLLPELSEEEIRTQIKTRYLLNSDKSVSSFFKGIFCDGITDELIRRSKIESDKLISDYSGETIVNAVLNMKNLVLTVNGTSDFSASQVTVGGVPTEELNDFFESKTVSGLYIVGELVNVDGPCGGYNLHWAFTSGAIAGENSCY